MNGIRQKLRKWRDERTGAAFRTNPSVFLPEHTVNSFWQETQGIPVRDRACLP